MINQSDLALISGINESQMQQYVLGLKKPGKKITALIEEGLKRYGNELKSIKFA